MKKLIALLVVAGFLACVSIGCDSSTGKSTAKTGTGTGATGTGAKDTKAGEKKM